MEFSVLEEKAIDLFCWEMAEPMAISNASMVNVKGREKSEYIKIGELTIRSLHFSGRLTSSLRVNLLIRNYILPKSGIKRL